MMMYAVVAAIVILMGAGVHAAHRNEAENAGMESYMDNEYRVVRYAR